MVEQVPGETESDPELKTFDPNGGAQVLAYDGRLGRVIWLLIVNTLLSIVTLSLYRFWGKTRLRQYLWRSVTLFGDRLEYSGQGSQLALGFLIVLVVLLPLLVV